MWNRIGFFLFFTAMGCVPSKQCPDPIGRIQLLDCDSRKIRFKEMAAEFKRLELPEAAFEDLKNIEAQLRRGCMGFNGCQYDDTEYRFRRDKLLTVLDLLDGALEGEASGAKRGEVTEFILYALAQTRLKQMFP